ncbi:MAG: hypothetical protein ABJ370_17035 [Paracoccaceae bacterium]
MSDAYEYGIQARVDRRKDLECKALNALWDGAAGDHAGVILQLRHRGNDAAGRANRILWSLAAVIFLGFAYYLGLPALERYVDGTRETLESQQATHLLEYGKLDQRRAALVAGSQTEPGLVQHLEFSATPVPSGVSGLLSDAIVDGPNILIYGDDGAITRSSNGGETFTPVPSGVNGSFRGTIVDGPNILIYGDDGAITRSTNGGESFTPIPSGVNGWFRGTIVDGPNILIYSGGGAITRSTNGGESFTPVAHVPSDIYGLLRDAIVDEPNILFYNGSGVITRSTNGGESFAPVLSGVDESLNDAIVDGSNILIYGSNGAITRSTNGGESFTPVPSGVNGWFTDAIVDGSNILIYGDDGAITRSTNGGESFTPIPSGVNGWLTDAIVDGSNILIYGEDGEITRSTNGGESFTPIPSGVIRTLNDAIVDGPNIVLYGDDGAITRSTNSGESFDPVPSGVNGRLDHAIDDGPNILFYGDDGAITRLDARWSDALSSKILEDGEQGDIDLARFMDDDLPENIQSWGPIVDARRTLSDIQARRAVLDELGTSTKNKLTQLVEVPALLKREEIRATFAAFLNVCRGDHQGTDTSADVTTACLEGWQAQLNADRQNWWQTLAVQVPPGVLLLFCLATLGALYRYSLRIAGFYHSRADALELIQNGMGPDEQAALTALATDLAADKVVFGKDRTPLEQAVDAIKAARG